MTIAAELALFIHVQRAAIASIRPGTSPTRRMRRKILHAFPPPRPWKRARS